jgi:NADPH:quinone reductase-like Zn-dependent oxidoreductase
MPKAYVFTEYGGPDVEAMLDLPAPEPGEGQVLVRVRAAGVNPADWKFREGWLKDFIPLELPHVFGSEVSGVVDAVGDGVDGFAPGDEIFGQAADGGYAEYALVIAAIAAHKPAAVSFPDAATLPVAAATAYDGIRHLGLAPGATLVIVGAGGGVGVAAAQFARADGIEVIGTASAGKRELVESLGATHVTSGPGVVERVRAAAPGGIDAVFDLAGGDALREAAELVDDKSKVVTAGDPMTAAEVGAVVLQRTPGGEVLRTVARLVQSGDLDPLVTQTFPLDRAREALAAVEGGHATGKVVVEVS